MKLFKKSAWWTEWLGRKIGLKDHDFWVRFLGDTWTGKPVTPERALQVSAYWATVRLIAQTMGTLPFGLYERNKDGGRSSKSDHEVYFIIHVQPNADQTAVEFWEGMAAQLCIWGNAYAEKLKTSGALSGLLPLKASNMQVRREDDGRIRYRYTENGKQREYNEEQILHIRGFGFGDIVGLSPLAYARQSLGMALATDEASARTFSNGMRPGGFFTYDKTLSQPQRDQAKKVLVDPFVGAENAGKIGILEAGFKWQDVHMPPEDAQMLEQRLFNVEDICRWLGVPPILIGHSAQGQTMWGSGVEQIIIGWLTLGLRPYLSRFEQAVNRSLLLVEERKKGLYSEMNIEGLLRADSTARANFFSTMVQNGIYTRNEVRTKENLPKVDGGDIITVQSNLTDILKLGEDASGDAARNALRNWLDKGNEIPARPKLEVVK